MHCTQCGNKNPNGAKYCFQCGKLLGGSGVPGKPAWMDILGVSLLFIVGLIGIHMHPLLESGIAAYIAVGATAVWVYADAPRYGKNRWPWILGSVALWIFVLPVYLAKTRGARGLIPGLFLVSGVVGMQFFPEVYTAKKHFERGKIYAGQQRLTKAEEEFRKAVQRDKNLGEAHLNLGIIYMSQGLLDAAEDELVLAKDLLDRYGVKMEKGTKNEALSLCLANLSAVYAMQTSEAIQLMDRPGAMGFFKKAQEYADQSLRLDPDNVRSVELVRRLENMKVLLQ